MEMILSNLYSTAHEEKSVCRCNIYILRIIPDQIMLGQPTIAFIIGLPYEILRLISNPLPSRKLEVFWSEQVETQPRR